MKKNAVLIRRDANGVPIRIFVGRDAEDVIKVSQAWFDSQPPLPVGFMNYERNMSNQAISEYHRYVMDFPLNDPRD